MTRFDLGDAPALLHLSESVGWMHSLEDWQTALAAGVVFGHRVAEQIQSSTALHKYGTELASIGQGIVRPEAQRQGLARTLLVECLRQVPAHPAMLVATPAGQPLYASLGFQIVEPVHRFVASGRLESPSWPGRLPVNASGRCAHRGGPGRGRLGRTATACSANAGSRFSRPRS